MAFGRQVSGGGPASVVVTGDSHASITTTLVQGAYRLLRDVRIDPAAVLGDLDPAEIVGRDWVYEAIDEFLGTQPHGYFLIEAAAGMGKTTLAASLAMRNHYPAHFGEATRQDTGGAALANLAAQLINEGELADFAPGGALPASAGDPVWFGNLLAASAEVARRDGGRLVLVVDGVDEMAAHPSGRPLGLPPALPQSVYVILTCRTGTRLRPGSPSRRLQISTGQPENRADVRLFVDRYASRHLTGLLAEAGLSRSAFVEAMTAASGGLWVYLKHLCDDVRHRRRRADGLDGLPADLNQYYIENLHRCLVECADRGAGVRLLAALAAARDPVSVETLATFAAVAPPDASGMLRGPLLPLLRERRDADLVRYSLYHRSLVEVLTGTVPAGSSGHQAIVDELREAVPPAHRRIAEHYLRLFGGLDEGLPALAADPTAAETDQRYPLHHLVEHLRAAGEQRRLHRLLTVRAPEQVAWAGVWFVAHQQAGTLYRYLTDVDLARSAAERETERALSRNGIAESLGAEVWYAVLTAMAADRMQEIPDALLQRLVEAGHWDLSQAIGYALALPGPNEQARALLRLYPPAPAVEQDRIRAIIRQNADHFGIGTLAQVARTLPAADLPNLLEVARRRAAWYEIEQFVDVLVPAHPAALAGLADLLPGPSRSRMLRRLAAATEPVRWAATTLLHSGGPLDDDLRMTASLVLAGRMPAAESADIVAACLAHAESRTTLAQRARCLAPLLRLAPGDPVSEMAAGLVARCHDADDNERAGVLRSIVADLPAELLPAALAVTRTLPPAAATPILTELAPRLDPADFAAAMDWIRTFPPDTATGELLTAIARAVPAPLFPTALAATAGLGDDARLGPVLAALAGNTPAEQAATMLEHARRVPSQEHRSVALARLLPHLPARQARQVGAQALRALAELPRPERVRSADIVLPLLPTSLLRDALAALQNHDQGYSRLVASAALTAYLPEPQAAETCGRLLTELVTTGNGDSTHEFLRLVVDRLPPGALEAAAGLARSIGWSDLRQISLSRVAARARGDLRRELLTEVLASFAGGWAPAAFRLLAPAVSDARRPELVAAALSSLDRNTGYGLWWMRVEALQEWIAEPERGELVGRAIDEAVRAPGELNADTLEVAARLAAAHAPARLDDLLASIAAMADERRGPALTAVAAVLAEKQAATALRWARQLTGHDRWAPVTALVPRLPRATGEALHAELLAESTTWTGRWETDQGARALVACHVCWAGDRPEAEATEASRSVLRVITALGDPAARVELAAEYLPVAPAELAGELIRLCCAALPTTEVERSGLPGSLARAVRSGHQRAGGRADPDVLRLFRHALRTAESLFLLQTVIPGTAELIADYGGEQAIENCLPPA